MIKFKFTILTVALNLHITSGYYCQNKQLIVNGTASSSEMTLYQTFGSLYGEFRTTANLDVKIRSSINKAFGVLSDKPDGAAIVINETIFSTLYSEFLNDSSKIFFPIAAMPLIIIHNVPNVLDLNLTMQNLADIYKGSIKFWNDSRLANLNPNTVLPGESVLPFARKDEDTTTALFTQILSNFDSDWNSTYGTFESPEFYNDECCNSKTWPPDAVAIFGFRSVGMIGLIASTEYSIGYTTLNSASRYSVNIANILANSGSELTFPTVPQVQVAVRSGWNNTRRMSNDLHMQIAASKDFTVGYPLTSYSYMVLNTVYRSNVDCCVVQEIVGFVHWLLTKSDETVLFGQGYIPLIEDVKRAIIDNMLTKVKCQQGAVYDAYLATTGVTVAMATWQLALIGVGVFGGLTLTACLANYAYQQKYNVDINRFLVEADRIKMMESKVGGGGAAKRKAKKDPNNQTVDANSVNSKLSEGSFRSHASSVGNRDKGVVRQLKEFMTPANLDETNKVYLDELVCKIPQQWSMSSKRTLAKLKNVVDKNVSMLLGITVINFCPWAIFEYCSKGTLHFALRTSRYNITDSIKMQFAFGVAQGLRYLHQYNIVHGYLSSLTCYLDISWTIKICQWEKCALYEYENVRDIKEFATYEPDANFDEVRLIELLYVDPDLPTRYHNTSVDLYSFGFLMVEIFTRKLPYLSEIEDEGTESYSNILHKKFVEKKILEPSAKYAHSPDLHTISVQCTGPPEDRPKMGQICTYLQKQTKKSSGIVDIIMDALEAHNDFLEEKVKERTADLNQMTDKMQDLLNEVLPPQIAVKLLAGIPVLPEYFESVSVYFSDIVGFTTISARSKPIEVMTFLNDLWLSFDSVMEKFDVYKVDTIGDAYLVCSGLPNRNGVEHSRQISLMALGLLDSCVHFKIRHLPDEQLKIRIGINSGPVGAGVIGSKLPQYCVFGDTVNTATTMESTSMALKIQVAETTYKLLTENFQDQFELEYRWALKADGKADIHTWWLLKENEK